MNFLGQHYLLIVIICAIALVINNYQMLFGNVSLGLYFARNVFFSVLAAVAILIHINVLSFWLLALVAFGMDGMSSFAVDVWYFFFLDEDELPEDDDEPESDEIEN